MNRRLYTRIVRIALLLALAALPVRALAPATQASAVTNHIPQYHEEVRVDPPLHLHVITVDLTDPRVSVCVARGGEDPDGPGPWQTKLQTVRTIATREKFAAAVNANFFNAKDAVTFLGRKNPYLVGNWGMVSGWAMSDGVLWSDAPALASIVVDDQGAITIGRFAKIPANAQQVASSGELLLNHGKNVAKSTDLAPRTAIGVDREGKRLTMLVVDGRREDYSVGLTGLQLADELIRLGCYDALLLDGGGSATMVMRDPQDGVVKLMSRPSDGHDLPISLSIERPVANVVGIAIKEDATTKP